MRLPEWLWNNTPPEADPAWRRCAIRFLATFVGALAIVYVFIVLVDPYDTLAVSLPFERRIVSISQRYMYPQIVRSRKFDSLIVGTSTARLIDPELLNGPFGARFANLAMNSMTAWEQKTMVEYFLRHAGAPKVLIVAFDQVWCRDDADVKREGPGGAPGWLYDDSRWNDYLYLLNAATLEIAGRLAGYKLGLYKERIRYDGYEQFTPDESLYDTAAAERNVWAGASRSPAYAKAPEPLPPPGRADIKLPALPWLDEMLSRLPPTTEKVLAFMPVHVAAQPVPGSLTAANENECKARIAAIGRKWHAKVIDWRIPSPITREDTNYWDSLHYRVPIAQRLAREIAEAAVTGAPSSEGTYRTLVP